MEADSKSLKRMVNSVPKGVVRVRKIRIVLIDNAITCFVENVEIDPSPAYILCRSSVRQTPAYTLARNVITG